jgi:hypothetical protein
MALPLRHLLDARFRASTRYGWTPHGALDSGARELLSGLQAEAGLAGLLTPASAGVAIRGLDAESAELWSALSEPGLLPAPVRAAAGDCVALARMVLDGVLEVEHEGRFVSGADAFPAVFGGTSVPEGTGPLARLSLEALEYGGSLELDDPIALSWRLYRYNTLPLTPEWRRRLPGREAVATYLGLDGFDRRAASLHAAVGAHRASAHGGWLTWDLRREPPAGTGEARWKLYVSPAVEALPEALHCVLGLLPDWTGAVSLKVGAGLPGLLRPDKCVAHFSTRDQLDAAAARLAAELDGMPAHGVPFSADAGGGLLSWGMDPPADRPVLRWLGVESWRLRITHQLAAALRIARTARPGAVAAPAFALGRILLEGVDPVTWAPLDPADPAEQARARH